MKTRIAHYVGLLALGIILSFIPQCAFHNCRMKQEQSSLAKPSEKAQYVNSHR
jgi:hypothetical protein